MKETRKEELSILSGNSPPPPPPKKKKEKKRNYIEDCLLKSGCQNLEGRRSLGEGIC